jgi:hypothetical protein
VDVVVVVVLLRSLFASVSTSCTSTVELAVFCVLNRWPRLMPFVVMSVWSCLKQLQPRFCDTWSAAMNCLICEALRRVVQRQTS